MTQNSEAVPSEAEAPARGAEPGGVAGLWPATAVTVLSSILCWLWLTSGLGAATRPEGGVAADTSALAQVDEQDVAAALATMSGPAGFLAQFRQRPAGCPLPLAWVAIAGAAGQAAGTIRLRSGNYYSPVFNLSDAPVRIAIPYPGPYEAGRGALTALHAGGGGVVALTPPWPVPAQGSEATRAVTWPTGTRCRQPNG